MAVELAIAQEAELDVAEAYVWYESQRAGLGEEFLSSVDACLWKAFAVGRRYVLSFTKITVDP